MGRFCEIQFGEPTVIIPSNDESLRILIDKIDVQKVFVHNWIVIPSKKSNFIARAYMKGNTGREYLHRLIANAKKDEVVIFNNGNGLDCRRSNLRKVNLSEFRKGTYETTMQ